MKEENKIDEEKEKDSSIISEESDAEAEESDSQKDEEHNNEKAESEGGGDIDAFKKNKQLDEEIGSLDSNFHLPIIETEVYKRTGFNIGKKYSDANIAEEKINDEINKSIELENDEIENVRLSFLKRKIDIENKKKFAKEKVNEINQQLKKYRSQYDKVDGDIISTKNELEETKQKLHDKYIFFGNQKRNIVQKRIEQLYSELEDLLAGYDRSLEKKGKTFHDEFSRNKSSLSGRANFLKELLKQNKENHDQLIEKVKLISNSGISFFTSNSLLTIGLTCAVIAGWFFSIFSLESSLNSDSVLFFILNGLFDFSNEVINIYPSNRIVGAIILFLGLTIVFLLFTFLFVFIDSRLLKPPSESTENENKIRADINYEDEIIKLKSNVSGNSFSRFWLAILPYILLATVLYTFLAVGQHISSNGGLTNLDTSLSGQLAGTIISITLGAIVYLYLVKIIEPRKTKSLDNKGNTISTNLELFFVTLCFTAIICISIAYFDFSSIQIVDGQRVSIPANAAKTNFTLIQFGFMSLVTALSIGYGWYYKSLITEQNRLEVKINKINEIIQNYENPLQNTITTSERELFNVKYTQITDQLMNLMVINNTIVHNALIGNLERKKPYSNDEKEDEADNDKNPLTRFWGSLANFFEKKNKRSKVNEGYNPSLTEEEVRLFPEIEAEIEQLKAKKVAQILKLEELEERFNHYMTESSNHERELKAKKIGFERILLRLETLDETDIRGFNFFIIRLKEIRLSQRNALQYGYDIGRWWRHSELNPNQG